MHRKTAWILAGCAALLLGAGPPVPEPPPTAGLPSGIEPLPPEVERRMEQLVERTQTLRALRLKRPVRWGLLGEEGLRRKIGEEVERELPPEKRRAVELGLEAFGLIPEDLDLGQFFPELLTEEIAGYYDPEQEYLVLVRREAGLAVGPDTSAGEPDEEAQKLDDAVLVHELAHALQDQHFDLETFKEGDLLSDEDAARDALVEGDAMLTMLEFVLDGAPARLGSLVETMLAAPEDMATLPGMGSSRLAAAPAWFRDTLVFSYLQGLAFCQRLKQQGGQELLDRAFIKAPPRSSEQILHPEKWLAEKRDDPVPIPWPDLASALPGYAKASEGQLGELGIGILLREHGASREKTALAAAGWGGDRFAVYVQDGRRVLAWVSEWDTGTDAAELEAALRRLGAGWHVRRPSPRRVQVVRGGLSEEGLEALHAALAGPAR